MPAVSESTRVKVRLNVADLVAFVRAIGALVPAELRGFDVRLLNEQVGAETALAQVSSIELSWSMEGRRPTADAATGPPLAMQPGQNAKPKEEPE